MLPPYPNTYVLRNILQEGMVDIYDDSIKRRGRCTLKFPTGTFGSRKDWDLRKGKRKEIVSLMLYILLSSTISKA